MKLKQLTPLLFGIILLASSCDDQEFGFNISKEVSVDIPVVYETSEVASSVNFNPPPVTEELRLAEFDAFADNLNELSGVGSLVINSIAYEITGIAGDEATLLDALVISTTAGSEEISLVSLTGGVLANTGRTDIPLTSSQLSALQSELLGGGNDLSIFVNIDFAAIPVENIDVNVRVYFDITLKIRE